MKVTVISLFSLCAVSVHNFLSFVSLRKVSLLAISFHRCSAKDLHELVR